MRILGVFCASYELQWTLPSMGWFGSLSVVFVGIIIVHVVDYYQMG
jgi:hypothetical protein